MLWDKWFEYSYPEDHKSLRVSPNSVGDFDNDGEVELACVLFNNTGDNQWHLMIYDAISGSVEYDLPGYLLSVGVHFCGRSISCRFEAELR